MAKSGVNDLTKIMAKISNAIKDSVKVNSLSALADEAIRLIVVRTRLGYSVRSNFATRSRLKRLSSRYVDFRIANRSRMSSLTTANRSNLTFTGQMLDSMKILSKRNGKLTIGPQGHRDDGETNERVAGYVSDQGRPFVYLSQLEFNQLLRFYRKVFGDLLRNQRLSFKPSR